MLPYASAKLFPKWLMFRNCFVTEKVAEMPRTGWQLWGMQSADSNYPILAKLVMTSEKTSENLCYFRSREMATLGLMC